MDSRTVDFQRTEIEETPFDCFKDSHGFVHFSGSVFVKEGSRLVILEPDFRPIHGMRFVVHALRADSDRIPELEKRTLAYLWEPEDAIVQIFLDGRVLVTSPQTMQSRACSSNLLSICLDPIQFLAADHESTIERHPFPTNRSPEDSSFVVWEGAFPSFYAEPSGFVHLCGIIHSEDCGRVVFELVGEALATVPAAFLPPRGEKFRCSARRENGDSITTNVHIHRDGVLMIYSGGAKDVVEVCLDGIVFLRKSVVSSFPRGLSLDLLRVEKTFIRHNWEGSAPFLTKDPSGRVRLQGMVKGQSRNDPILVLPEEFRPRSFCRFSSQTYCRNGARGRVSLHLHPTGELVLSWNIRSVRGFVHDFSLCGVSFDTVREGRRMGEGDGFKRIRWGIEEGVVSFDVSVVSITEVRLFAFSCLLC